MLDPITRLRAARFDGPQALYTEAVRLLSERPALPDDLAGLVARLREAADIARSDFAEAWFDAQHTGERPDLEQITAELTVEQIEAAACAIEAQDAVKAEARKEWMCEAAQRAALLVELGAEWPATTRGKVDAILAAIPKPASAASAAGEADGEGGAE